MYLPSPFAITQNRFSSTAGMNLLFYSAQSDGDVEFNDCISAEG